MALDPLLEQETPLRPQKIMTDTVATRSDAFSGLFRPLGRRLGPRLADIGGACLRRIDGRRTRGPSTRPS